MSKTIVKIDLSESPYKNEMIHNRWHPDVPIIEWVKPGEDFVIETYDWTGGFIKNNESADDVRDIDLSIVHFLSGPIGVHGAEPGDLLVVDILDIGILPESPGASTASSPRRTVVAFSPIIFRWRRSRSGIFRASTRIPVTSPGSGSPASSIPV